MISTIRWRGKNMGLSKGFTIFLGAAELAGSLGVMFGVLRQLAARGLVVVIPGAIYRRILFGTPDSGAKGQTVAAEVGRCRVNVIVILRGGACASLSSRAAQAPLQAHDSAVRWGSRVLLAARKRFETG